MQSQDVILVGAKGFWKERARGRDILPAHTHLHFSDRLEIDGERWKNVHAIVVADQKVGASVMDKYPNLRTIARTGTGYDNVDVVEAKKRGVVVTRVAAINAEATSEFALGLLFALSKHIVLLHTSMIQERWTRAYGIPIGDLTVGVIGLGHIGRALVRRLHQVGVKKILGWNRTQQRDEFRSLFLETEFELVESVHELLIESDAVIVAVALTQETKGFIGEDSLARMKSTAFLINVCRGAVVDEDALARYVAERKIGGVALDVFSIEAPHDLELFQRPFMQSLLTSARNGYNVILTPHNASVGRDTVELISRQVAKNIEGVLSGNMEHVDVVP